MVVSTALLLAAAAVAAAAAAAAVGVSAGGGLRSGMDGDLQLPGRVAVGHAPSSSSSSSSSASSASLVVTGDVEVAGDVSVASSEVSVGAVETATQLVAETLVLPVGQAEVTASGLLLGEPVGGYVGTCTPEMEGALGYRAPLDEHVFCDGREWLNLETNLPVDPTPTYGRQANDPGLNCADVLERVPGSPDGVYWLDPDGVSPAATAFVATQCFCDMTTDLGGWTLALRRDWADSGTSLADAVGAVTSANLHTVAGGTGKLADAFINALRRAPDTEAHTFRLTSANVSGVAGYYAPGTCTYDQRFNSDPACKRFQTTFDNGTPATSPAAFIQCETWSAGPGLGGGGLDFWFGCGSETALTTTNVAITSRPGSLGGTTVEFNNNPTGAATTGFPLGNAAFGNGASMWVR